MVDPDTKVNPHVMWLRIVFQDRWYSLMLGLPQGTLDTSMATEARLAADMPMGRLESSTPLLPRASSCATSKIRAWTTGIPHALSMPISSVRPDPCRISGGLCRISTLSSTTHQPSSGRCSGWSYSCSPPPPTSTAQPAPPSVHAPLLSRSPVRIQPHDMRQRQPGDALPVCHVQEFQLHHRLLPTDRFLRIHGIR